MFYWVFGLTGIYVGGGCDLSDVKSLHDAPP